MLQRRALRLIYRNPWPPGTAGWCEAPSIAYPPANRDESLSQVKQGVIGDCWFVAAAAAVAAFDPAWVPRHLVATPTGWALTLYRFGLPVTVQVSAVFPLGANGQLLGARCGETGRPNWLSLYEKGASTILAGRAHYRALNRGLADAGLRLVTGRRAWPLGTRNLMRLARALRRGPVLLSSKAPTKYRLPRALTVRDDRIAPAHVYIVSRIFRAANTWQAELINPWGGAPLTLTQAEITQNFMASQRVDLRA